MAGINVWVNMTLEFVRKIHITMKMWIMGQVLQPGVHCYFVFVLSMFSGILEQSTSVFMTVVADRTAMAIDMSDATLAKTFDI